jgi:perosamine synthetase
MTFVRAVSPLTHMRLIPVLADINPEFGTITLEGIEQVFSNKTKAVLIVHMWGVPVDMDPIINFCKEKGILIIEDFSHAHFSEYKDQKTGTFGDISFASIQRKKLISVGEGGIITTNSLDYFEKLKNIVSPGSFEKDMAGYGLNFRMNHFGVGALQYLLPKISSIVQERFELVKIFKSIANEYPNIISLPKIPEYATFISHYSIKVKVVDFEKLNQLPFKVKDFGYDFITNSIFWDKQSSNNFLQDTHKPKSLEHYPNTIKYLENNRTLDF